MFFVINQIKTLSNQNPPLYKELRRRGDCASRVETAKIERTETIDPLVTYGPPVPYFFLPATVLTLPLRVRALVLVRCPLTGSPLMWRLPR